VIKVILIFVLLGPLRIVRDIIYPSGINNDSGENSERGWTWCTLTASNILLPDNSRINGVLTYWELKGNGKMVD